MIPPECSFNGAHSLGGNLSGDALVLGYDFYALLAATRVLLAGGDPYSLCAYLNELHTLGRLPSLALPFPYPPTIFFLTGPFALLPPSIAVYCWTMLQVGVLWGVVSYLKNKLLCKKPSTFFVFPVLLFPGVVRHVVYGQVTILLLAIFLSSLHLWKRERYFLSGFIALLAIAKPHLALLPLVAFALRAVLTREWGWILGAGLGVLLQGGILLVFSSNVVFSFVKNLLSNLQGHHELMNSIFEYGFFPEGISFLNLYIFPLAAVTAVFVFVPQKSRFNVFDILVMALALSLLITPYLWLHDAVLLLPLFLLIMNRLADKRGYVFGILFTLLVPWLWQGGYLLVSPHEWMIKLLSIGFIAVYWSSREGEMANR